MSESKELVPHTPGPWKAVMGAEDEPDRWLVVADTGTNWMIATIENGAPGDTLDTEEATARLIAAAPDLLRACEEALSMMEGFDLAHGERGKLLRASIAKATTKPA